MRIGSIAPHWIIAILAPTLGCVTASRHEPMAPQPIAIPPGELRIRLSRPLCKTALRRGDRFSGSVSRMTVVLQQQGAIPQQMPDTTFPTGVVADVVVTSTTSSATGGFEVVLRRLRLGKLHSDSLGRSLDMDPELFDGEPDAKCYPEGDPLIGFLTSAE